MRKLTNLPGRNLIAFMGSGVWSHLMPLSAEGGKLRPQLTKKAPVGEGSNIDVSISKY